MNTIIRAKTDLYNKGLCFTKGNTYEVPKHITTEASLMDIEIVNDLGERHLVGGWWREFEIVEPATEETEDENKLKEILDFDKCKQLVDDAKAKGETCVILCPHYSINVQSKFEDGEQLQWDLDELEQHIGETVQVSDFDDLVVYLVSEDEDEDNSGNDDNESKYFRNNNFNGANLD